MLASAWYLWTIGYCPLSSAWFLCTSICARHGLLNHLALVCLRILCNKQQGLWSKTATYVDNDVDLGDIDDDEVGTAAYFYLASEGFSRQSSFVGMVSGQAGGSLRALRGISGALPGPPGALGAPLGGGGLGGPAGPLYGPEPL